MSEAKLSEIDHIYIDESVRNTEVAERALKLFSVDKISYVTSAPYADQIGSLSARQFDRSKREIYITNFKGQFFKRCPGARPGLTCCNYFVLNLGQQCNMNCSYCYLQSFINSPVMKIYANIDQALDELSQLGRDLGDQPLRVGTGEVIDSLSLDELTLYSVKLIKFFRDYPKWRLEFKTKSSRVDQFLNIKHASNVIVSFSINPQNIVESEEHGTASFYQRLLAAEKARDKGYLVSFHIDPMIYHSGWQDSYSQLVDEVTKRFKPSDVCRRVALSARTAPHDARTFRGEFASRAS
jgi:spore photoproduct lyase